MRGVYFQITLLQLRTTALPVGASTLAMVVNENAGCLNPRGARTSIASRLAPTERRKQLWERACSRKRSVSHQQG
ncbi:hypothetical protein CES87_04790 [Pseudomonas sp. ERMR1:02]|nr:hypothetical protein CES87_04790 [Pseudomonas sp. ERMR1:02]